MVLQVHWGVSVRCQHMIDPEEEMIVETQQTFDHCMKMVE
jgi:hypothetical protein